MNKIIAMVFFAAGLIAYGMFFASRAHSFALADYHQDAMALAMLGLLGHFAFAPRAAA